MFYEIKNNYENSLLMYGDWGLGIGDWANPQSPIPNPQSPKIYNFLDL